MREMREMNTNNSYIALGKNCDDALSILSTIIFQNTAIFDMPSIVIYALSNPFFRKVKC